VLYWRSIHGIEVMGQAAGQQALQWGALAGGAAGRRWPASLRWPEHTGSGKERPSAEEFGLCRTT